MECLVITPAEHLMLQDREGNRFRTLYIRMYIDTVADNDTFSDSTSWHNSHEYTNTTKCIKYFHYNSATKIRMSLDEFYVLM